MRKIKKQLQNMQKEIQSFCTIVRHEKSVYFGNVIPFLSMPPVPGSFRIFPADSFRMGKRIRGGEKVSGAEAAGL